MRLRGSVVPLIETAYETLGQPRQVWLDTLRTESVRLFDGIIDAGQVWEFEFDAKGGYRTVGLSADEPFRSVFHVVQAVMPRKLWRYGHLDNPVPTLLDVIGGDVNSPAYRAISKLGVREMAGAVALDPSGQGVVLSWFRRQTGPLSPSVRHALERIAAHVARAVRLRNRLSEEEEAVLAPDGKVLHAEHDAREAGNREALREAARRIDRARSQEASQEEAIELWNALVEGRWSLIERFESDGRRILVAHRNAPATHRNHALTDGERKVTALLAIGHSQKLIAYELGVSEARVSAQARSAMSKLGVKSRTELIELQGAIVDTLRNDHGR